MPSLPFFRFHLQAILKRFYAKHFYFGISVNAKLFLCSWPSSAQVDLSNLVWALLWNKVAIFPFSVNSIGDFFFLNISRPIVAYGKGKKVPVQIVANSLFEP